MIKIVESKKHGKAVAGKKRTSSWQVRDYYPDGIQYMLKKTFSFTVGNNASRASAWTKADNWVREHAHES